MPCSISWPAYAYSPSSRSRGRSTRRVRMSAPKRRTARSSRSVRRDMRRRRLQSFAVNPEVEQLRPRLKEILYDCAVEVRATKAALYLFDGVGRYDLIAEYGFRGVAREWLDRNQPGVDPCGRGPTPSFITAIAAEPRFSEYLYEASTDHLLAAPIYSRGELVGLIDMRDKQGRAPFDAADLGKAQQIADRMISLFATKNLFRQRFVTLSAVSPAPADAPPPLPAP